MKAFIVKNYGKEEKLHLTDLSEPAINENDVLVQVHSAAVNVIDLLIRNGDFKLFLPLKSPFQLGRDVAGVIVKLGSKVRNFKVGDEVYSSSANHHVGTFAEFISIAENEIALKPKNLSMEEASSIPLVGLTAWQALVELANVQKGQKVFIQAGSGGVGTFAIQLAKHLGATVATTTSSANFNLVKRLGADIVIDYKTQDFETLLKEYDVVLHSNKDTKILEKSLRVLRPNGQLISLVGPPTPEFAEQIGLPGYLKFITKLLSFGIKRKAKKLNVKFTFLFMKADGKQLSQISSLIELGKIKAVVDQVFPFEQTNNALSYVETGRSKGKVVVKIK
ncbi:MAG: NADP-dependent oxidoreductase [Saprospiraceae bacterium]|nr:NADP-dependent oxidoreductase [Saprospiraceae bacterium]MBK7738432.1 NADP-dependent oxidoreductase [Saprospiraceae bacterium]MBK7912999.1 NADP-dependent oxidoreductase [Saprospiraceae bacterium]